MCMGCDCACCAPAALAACKQFVLTITCMKENVAVANEEDLNHRVAPALDVITMKGNDNRE